jgi:hypothetical protein
MNIMLAKRYEINNLDYEAYPPIIYQAVSPIGIASASINERWTKFLLHGASQYLIMEEVRKEVETQYKNFPLARTLDRTFILVCSNPCSPGTYIYIFEP